jgi:hypothetical protein
MPATTTTTPPTTTTLPAPISAEAIRAAKVGWSRFVADNFATPNAVTDPCPLLAPDAATAGVQALGLVPSALPFGVALYRDQTGAGIIGVRCGVDLAAAANPAGSTGFAVEATLLDGQAVFPQYVVRVAGQNTPVTPAPDLGGDTIARCRFQPTVCVASWHNRGLVVTVRLDGPRTDASEAQTRQLLATIAPEVVTNLAAVTPPP